MIVQCTELIQINHKQQNQWYQVSTAQDVIQIFNLIKQISFRFEDQNFLPSDLYQAKATLLTLRQGNMTNHDYLQQFLNIDDMETAYNGQLHYTIPS